MRSSFYNPFFEVARAEFAVGEKLTIAGAGADGAFQALSADVAAHVLQLRQVGEQVLTVLGKAVADGGRFGGLDVGKGDSGRVGFGFNAGGDGGESAFLTYR